MNKTDDDFYRLIIELDNGEELNAIRIRNIILHKEEPNNLFYKVADSDLLKNHIVKSVERINYEREKI